MTFFRHFLDELDYYIEKDRYVVQVETPGVKPEDINISKNGLTVTVEGRRKSRTDPTKTDRLYRRSFTIPSNSGEVSATYENGIVYIFVNKPVKEEPERIELKYQSNVNVPLS